MEFVTSCLSLFNDTLTAIWSVSVLRFFLSAALLAVASALVYVISHSAKR